MKKFMFKTLNNFIDHLFNYFIFIFQFGVLKYKFSAVICLI